MSKSLYIKTLLWMAWALVALACEKEADNPSSAQEVQTVHYRATVHTGVDTKATVGDDMKYKFEEGDRLYVESADKKLYGFLSLSAAGGAGNNMALFEGDLIYAGETSFPNDNPVINLVLVSKEDELHTITDGKVDAVTSASYLANKWAPSLEDAVSHLSHFTGTGNFNDPKFTLNQQSGFLKCFVKIDPKEAPAESVVTVSLYNNNTSTLLRTASIPLSHAGSVPFVFAFLAGDELASARLHVEWGNPDAPQSKYFSITDHFLAANTFYSISRSAFVSPYFRIKAKQDGTWIKFKYDDGSVQYSTDYGETWPDYKGGKINLNADDEVWFKGNRSDCNCQGGTQLFTANYVCYIAGNIASLLDDNLTTIPTNAFRSAFSYGSINDKDAEKEKSLPVSSGKVDWVDIDPSDPLILPASTAPNCYLEMFLGCTSLHSAPELPATVLEDKCYFRMFYGCTSLTSIPSLPSEVTWRGASNKHRQCFQMYQYCTGITKLEGSLPAMLDENCLNCFEDMFAHCTGLVSVDPEFLPATTLVPHCYRGMFQDTRFERAPNLPAATLVTECYRYMFNACTQLNYIKCLATTNLGNGFTTNWVSNVPSGGIFYKSPDIEASKYPTGSHGIPSGWTVRDYGEE